MATSARALHERLHFNQKVARGQPEATAALIVEVDVSPVAFGSGTRVFGAVNGPHLVDNPSDVTQGGRLNAEAVRGVSTRHSGLDPESHPQPCSDGTEIPAFAGMT